MKYNLVAFKGDLLGGLTTAVVALPVCLAFGVASGLGPQAGIYSAIASGFFAAVFGGTRTQISGPTAPMAVAMAVIVTSHATTLEEALTIVVLAGIFQMLLGISRIGRFIVYTPYVVVSGFMSGIGIIIILMQALPALGAPSPLGGAVDAVQALPDAIRELNADAVAVTLVTLAVAVFWPNRFGRVIPAPLAALLVGTCVGLFWFTGAPAIAHVPSGIPGIQVGMPGIDFLVSSIEPALLIALLASVDSLLTSLVADSMTGTYHKPNKELFGQGIGNVIAGIFGGLPGCGSTPMTTTNIRAGASTRASGMMFAVLMLVILLGAGDLLEPVPLAVLSGILLKVGWDIVDWRLLSVLHRIRREQLVVMLTTLAVTVLVDLVTAVAVGLIVAGMAHALQLESLELDNVMSVPILDSKFFAQHKGVVTSDPLAARVGLVSLRGRFTVASSKKLTEAVGADIKDHQIVIFDFSAATHFDDSAAMVIDQLIGVAEKVDTTFIVMGLSGNVLNVLVTLNVLSRVPKNLIVETLDEAREVAAGLLGAASDNETADGTVPPLRTKP